MTDRLFAVFQTRAATIGKKWGRRQWTGST